MPACRQRRTVASLGLRDIHWQSLGVSGPSRTSSGQFNCGNGASPPGPSPGRLPPPGAANAGAAAPAEAPIAAAAAAVEPRLRNERRELPSCAGIPYVTFAFSALPAA